MPHTSPKILIIDLPTLPLITNVEGSDYEEWFIKTVKFVRRNLRGEASGHYKKKQLTELCRELCEIWPEPLAIYTPEDMEVIEQHAQSKKKGYFYRFCRAMESKKNDEIHEILEEWLFASVKEKLEDDLMTPHVIPLLDDSWEVVEGLMLANDERTVVSIRLEH